MKKGIFCGIVLCIATQSFAAGGKPPLAFFTQPHFPRTTYGGTSTFEYILVNNTPVTLPLTISTPTFTSGSVSLSSGTCGATLAASAKCDLNYTFTAPPNSSSTPLDITGSFQIAYNGRYPLTDTTLRFIVPKDAPEFIEQPDFSPPITVPSATQFSKLNYFIKNNLSTTITNVSFSPTVSSGSIVASGGSCGSSLAGGATCSKTFTFTAPTNTGSTDISVTGTMTLNYTDTSPQTLAGDNLAFSITTGASIIVPEHSLMFPTRDFGNSHPSSYTGKITISNNGGTAITSITTEADEVNFISTTCSFPLAPGSTCTDTFSSPIPVKLNTNVQLTPYNSSGAGNTVTVPISGLGVLALAPPTDTSVGLTLVNGCTDTTNDGGLIMITNNTSQTLSNITISASDGLSATITNTAFSPDHNVYCNGQQLAPNGYCEFRVASSAAAGTTGDIIIHGSLVSSDGTITHAHHYNLQAKVVAQASPFPYTVNNSAQGGTIFIATNSCNLVEIYSSPNATNPSDQTWNKSNAQCKNGTGISGGSNWRLPDVGPTFSVFDTIYSTESGEPPQIGPLTENSSIGVWLSPISASLAWQISGGLLMLEAHKDTHVTFTPPTYCVQAFTTNSDGT